MTLNPLTDRLARQTHRMRSSRAHDRMALALLEECGLHMAQQEAEITLLRNQVQRLTEAFNDRAGEGGDAET